MKKITRYSALIVMLGLILVLTSCSSLPFGSDSGKMKEVKVAVVGNSDDPIWTQVNKELAKDHIKVKLVKFTTGSVANLALADNDLDLTAFQHYAALKQEEKEYGYKFAVMGQSYIMPLKVYSTKITDLRDIKYIEDKVRFVIPNDTTNAGRALKILESAGVIKLDPSKGYAPTLADITENKYKVGIIEVKASRVPGMLPDFVAGITNSNYMVDSDMDPNENVIYKTDPNPDSADNKPWINVIVARAADKNNSIYKKVIAAYHTKAVAEKIKQLYGGDVYVPAFDY